MSLGKQGSKKVFLAFMAFPLFRNNNARKQNCYFMIPRCVYRRPVGENNICKYTNWKFQRGNCEIQGKESCMFIVGTGVLVRRGVRGMEEESKEV